MNNSLDCCLAVGVVLAMVWPRQAFRAARKRSSREGSYGVYDSVR